LTVDYRPYQDVAERAARSAGQLLIESFDQVQAHEKGPSDLVTQADFESQRLIARILLDSYPTHTVLAEEEGLLLDAQNPWRWVVDPLDGTINFAHGNPLWCVSIALEHLGVLVVGVVHHPLNDTTHSASMGNGSTVNGRTARVSGARSLRESLIATGMPTNFAADADRLMAFMRRFSTGTHSVRRTGTSAWNLAMVASGGFDVCYGTAMNPWDCAAGAILIQEAGGTVTDLRGKPFTPYCPEILATNGTVHPEAVECLEEAWPAAHA
jgi:myo-inositol-1(or 4)-monophosphatase